MGFDINDLLGLIELSDLDPDEKTFLTNNIINLSTAYENKYGKP